MPDISWQFQMKTCKSYHYQDVPAALEDVAAWIHGNPPPYPMRKYFKQSRVISGQVISQTCDKKTN